MFRSGLIVHSHMTPLMELSVHQTQESQWALQTMMVCERDPAPSPHIISWADPSGVRFSVRERTKEERDISSDTPSSEAAEGDRIHKAGTGAAVWKLGGAFVKVKAWRKGMELEAETIAFVKQKASSVPVPEVLHSWIDHAWNRSFTIIRAINGDTLANVWKSLQDPQRQSVAATVADYCAQLAQLTSPTLQTATSHGVLEPFLTIEPPFEEPSWKPNLLGPFSPSDLDTYLNRGGSGTPKGLELDFHFYHADLGPTNIMVSEDGELSGIIDWESAGYYPRFWLGTKPLVSAGFYLPDDGSGIQQRKEWALLLADHLKKAGFPSDLETYACWKRTLRARTASKMGSGQDERQTRYAMIKTIK